MNAIPITMACTHIPCGQTFFITIAEPSCNNCSWHVDLPPVITLITRDHNTATSPHSTTWTFSSQTPGTYTIEFLYRKRCCGRPKLKQETYTIIIY